MGKNYGGYSSSSKQVSELRPPKSMEPISDRSYNRPLSVDFSIIAQAQEFYGEKGYLETAVPWVVGHQAYLETKPEGAKPYKTLGGYLVGSAEQSFVEMMLRGEKLGRAQATTPCFRDEDHDEIHHPYFMKTELIDTVALTPSGLERMIADALEFFNLHVPSEILPIGDGSFDIVTKSSGLELGSYGFRCHADFAWIYGTGVALPRLSQAIGETSASHG